MNADRYYDTPYGDAQDRERAYDSCISDTETTTRDAIVAILGAAATHIAAGRGLHLPAQREALADDAVDAAATHLDTLAGLLEHHGFEGSVEEPVHTATAVFITAITDAAYTYTTHVVGQVEEQATDSDWEPATRPPFLLPRTA